MIIESPSPNPRSKWMNPIWRRGFDGRFIRDSVQLSSTQIQVETRCVSAEEICSLVQKLGRWQNRCLIGWDLLWCSWFGEGGDSLFSEFGSIDRSILEVVSVKVVCDLHLGRIQENVLWSLGCILESCSLILSKRVDERSFQIQRIWNGKYSFFSNQLLQQVLALCSCRNSTNSSHLFPNLLLGHLFLRISQSIIDVISLQKSIEISSNPQLDVAIVQMLEQSLHCADSSAHDHFFQVLLKLNSS